MKSNQAIDYLLQHVAAMWSKQLDQALQEQLGIGVAQHRVLSILKDSQGLDQRAIARRLGQTEAGISRQIKLLAEKGMLLAETNTKNQRQHVIVLTPKGTKITEAGDQVMDHYSQPMLQGLSDKQQKQLAEALAMLHDHTCRQGKLLACNHQPS